MQHVVYEGHNSTLGIPELPPNAFTYMEDKGVQVGQSLDMSATAPSLLRPKAIGEFIEPGASDRHSWSVPAIIDGNGPLWVVCRQERLYAANGMPFLGGPELAIVDPNAVLEAHRRGGHTRRGIIGEVKMGGHPVVFGEPGARVEVSARMGVLSIKNSGDASRGPLRVTQFSEKRYGESMGSGSVEQPHRQSRVQRVAKVISGLLHF